MTRWGEVARMGECPKCRVDTLYALDTLGGEARVHWEPLTVYGELMALSGGERTWQHEVTRRLTPRFAHQIAYKSAADIPVYVAHTCGRRPEHVRLHRLHEPFLDHYDEPPF